MPNYSDPQTDVAHWYDVNMPGTSTSGGTLTTTNSNVLYANSPPNTMTFDMNELSVTKGSR